MYKTWNLCKIALNLNEFKLDIVITTSEMYKTWNLCNLNVQNMKPVQNCTGFMFVHFMQ